MYPFPVTQINLPPGLIDLGMGNPDFSLLPLNLLDRAARTFFADGDPRPLQYGAEAGNGDFRCALADFLSPPGSPLDPGLLFVTSGASSALDLVCTLHTRPGDVVFVEEPTYFLALRIFADHGLQVVSIPMDDDGLDVDFLAAKLTEVHPKLVYTIPTFQNPSGRTLSLARRKQLVELAQRHNFLIAADEVYQLLPYSQTPPKPFADFVEAENVISINSFSKILAPGLRLGWITAHPQRIAELAGSGLLDSGGGLNPFTSAIVRYVIASGDLAGNTEHLRAVYAARLAAMDESIHRHLPQAEYTRPGGGFFFWVRIPGLDAAGLRETARAAGVDFRPGNLFSGPGALRDFVRLSFCFYNPEEIEQGIQRLAACLPG